MRIFRGLLFPFFLLAAVLVTAYTPEQLPPVVVEWARSDRAVEQHIADARPAVRRIDAARTAGAGVVQFELQTPPEAISRAYLVYELEGVSHWTATVRAINALPAVASFGAVPSLGTTLQIEEINPRWLRAGLNQISFFPAHRDDAPPSRVTNLHRADAFAATTAPHSSIPYTVRNLRLVYVDGSPQPAPRLTLSHPLQGENDAAGAVLRGFVDPAGLPTGPAELFVNEVYLPRGIHPADGSFAVFVPRTASDADPWEARIEVVYADGSRLRQTVKLAALSRDGEGESDEDSAELDAGADTAKSLGIGKARLELTPGALRGKVKLTMRRLGADELPAMDAGMTNVTPGGRGFRFGPHGLRFDKAVELSLPYDTARIPRGLTAEDIRTFFFDDAAGRWIPLSRIAVKTIGDPDAKTNADVIVSATDHFTDFVNATLALPDEPAGGSTTSNSLQELATADPASKIVEIEAPDGGATGDAMLQFPLVVPPGRMGLEPELAVEYNSSHHNGWLGVGWDLRIPNIEISTLFGVPRYDGTERYFLGGEQLAATSTPGVFVRRSEGSFDRIVRHENGPATFWWEVTDKSGTRFLYGQSPGARLRHPQSNDTFRWLLERAIDLHGNTIDYTYFTDQGSNGEPWREIYPARIDYNGGPGVAAFYHVIFHLDDGDRPDRLSSGRPGFKTYMRHRLAGVDVLAGNDVVRKYIFTYREGDFHKSLLTSIAVQGEDGAEFYRHSFDYVPMEVEADGYAAFAQEQAWGGIGSGTDLTGSQRIGGGAHGFAGLGPPECQPHAGIQTGGSGTGTMQPVVFLDVNGDGLPDRLDDDGDVDLNGYDPAADPGGSNPGSFSSTHFAHATMPGRTLEWSLDFGAGVHAEAGITASLDTSWIWSHANDDHIVADVNGDLRPDLVSTDGGFSVRVNDGTSFTDTPSNWSDFTSTGLDLSSDAEEQEVLSSFHLANPLRQLVLPYDGRVHLSGAIQKAQATGDGVDVAIYRNAGLVWNRRIAGDSVEPCEPGPNNSCSGGLSLDVSAGDSLYFLAASVRDTSADDLAWTPVVTYDGQDPQAREPYGARVFVFDADADFSLAGYRGASWAAAANGTVRIVGDFVKHETSDDVALTISRTTGGVEHVVFSRTFAASDDATFGEFPAVTVAAGDFLSLRLSAATPIDPSRITWTPKVAYEGNPDLPEDLRTQPAQVAMSVPEMAGNAPTRSWTASGEQTLAITCNASAAMLYVQGINRLLATRRIDMAQTFAISVSASTGEPLFLTLFGDGTLPPGTCTVNPGAVPVNVRWRHDGAAAPRVLSGGHHGWFYGEWNGNVPFNASALVRPAGEDDTPDYVSGAPRWEGTKGTVDPVWTGTGFDSYVAAKGVKPSRRGANAAGVLDEASGTTDGGELNTLRKTVSRTAGISASAGAGLALGWGESDTQLELLDMNGDQYPDQVSASGVRFSNGTTGFGDLEDFHGLATAVRRSTDGNITASLGGIGLNFSKKDGQGKAAAVLSSLPSIGSTVSLTQTNHDLIDVNGDALPDRVSIDPGSDEMTVRLNLGYRFGAPETWNLPTLSSSNACKDAVTYVSDAIGSITNLDTLNGISFTRSSAAQIGVAVGPFGGGVSTSLARTLVDLIDVNGDGLADRVAKDHDDAFFRVQLNLGDRWDHEQRWYVPAWSSSIGDGYNPSIGGESVFQCLDAVSFSGHVEGNVSAGAPVCIPLVDPIIVAGLQIELSAQAFFSTRSGLQLFLDDLDGDGFADHVLKKAGDGNVYVKRNQASRVNLLKTVHRPLGSTIELSYERRGNHADMPFSQWVLSSVSVDDGRDNTYVTRYAYGNDAYYDRAEREIYGFPHVRITLPDGSTIERDFLNRDLYSRHLQTREAIADAAGNLFRVETMRYEQRPAIGISRFPALVAETTAFYEGTASAEKQTSRTYEYDSLGNVIRETDFADAGTGDDVVTVIAYHYDPATHATRAASIEVKDGNDRLLRRRNGTYNSTGDLTQLEQVLIGGRDPENGSTYSGSKNAVSTFTYDAFGNLASSVRPNDYTLTFTYDPATRSYPSEAVDSFGYVQRYAYDLKYGEVAESVDENSNAMRRTYDRFGRLVRVVGPYDTDDAPALRFEYGRGGAVTWAVVRHKDFTRSDTIDSAVFIDSLARVLQTKEDADLDLGSGTSTRSGMRVSGRVAFDAKGRMASEGQPAFDDGPANELVAVPAKNPTTFTYDALDRVRTVRFPHGAITRVDYGFGSLGGARRLLTTRTDPAGRVTRFYRDVQDNVVAVEQTNTIAGARKTLVTRYTYDALDQLTAVTDAKGNPTLLEYDTLGRNVVLHNPDAGRTELRYDPAGELGAHITANLAARGQQVRYFYTFGRLDRIDYPQSPDVAYIWGGPGAPFQRANRIGTAIDGSGLEERFYGKLGEVVQTVKTVTALNGSTPKGPYATRFEYDDFHRLLSVVYPDGETLTYGFDSGGQVKSAAGVLKGVRFEYLRHFGYDEFGEPARMILGNGVETRYTYDAASRFLTQLRAVGAGRDLQNLRYQYDLTGTLQAVQNDVPVPDASLFGGPSSQTFVHDDLVQLVGAQGTYRTGPNKVSSYALSLGYDELGNIVAKNQLHQLGNGGKLNEQKKTTYDWAYSYGGPQPHAPTRVGERAFTYDLNGNQAGWTSDVNGTRRTLAWDEENRLASVADNGQTTRFVYDANGMRTNKAGAQGETLYVNSWFTLRNGAIASKHVFADELRLATKVSPNPDPSSEKVYFFQSDRLGSTHFVTDELATVYEHLEYFPFGEVWVDERAETQRTPYLFSGKELDEETGLSYFGYRYYDARQGQWINADPILDEMLDGDGWMSLDIGDRPFFLPGHLYGYVANDPTDLTDPDGLAKRRKTGPPIASRTRKQKVRAKQLSSNITKVNIVQASSGKRYAMRTDRKGPARLGLGDGTSYGLGPYAVSGVRTTNITRSFKKKEKSGVNKAGRQHGCHTCGTKISGWPDGHFTPDHQPPLSRANLKNKKYKGTLYPHCKSCSSKQGGILAGMKAAGH